MNAQSYTIGIDIGGTHTDAVLVDDSRSIAASAKAFTSQDISQGFQEAITCLLHKSQLASRNIQGIFLGTTHAINAILQCQGLYRVGVIRLAGHQPQSLPSCYQWPEVLKRAVWVETETIDGGWECDGRPITVFNPEQALRTMEILRKRGAESLAVSGVFSPLNGEQERQVAACVGKEMPLSLSSEIGGVGFIERENSTILNAALKKVMAQGFLSLQTTCQNLGLNCPLFITQNDGSAMTLERAMEYPILTMSAGPTNSFRGGAWLARQTNAIVVDVGGTSTDVGLVCEGFPRRSLNTSVVGGVRLNFPMPDVLSIGLGGGSCIRLGTHAHTIGPESVSKELMKRSKAFGGDQLTLTDAALVARHMHVSQANLELVGLPVSDAKQILAQALEKIKALIQAMRGQQRHLPVVWVGGGATLFSREWLDSTCVFPLHFDVANAYGATLSEIAGTVDTVVSLSQRTSTLERLQQEAHRQAILQGADPKGIRVIDQRILPYPYLPNQMARVIIRVSGPRVKSSASY